MPTCDIHLTVHLKVRMLDLHVYNCIDAISFIFYLSTPEPKLEKLTSWTHVQLLVFRVTEISPICHIHLDRHTDTKLTNRCQDVIFWILINNIRITAAEPKFNNGSAQRLIISEGPSCRPATGVLLFGFERIVCVRKLAQLYRIPLGSSLSPNSPFSAAWDWGMGYRSGDWVGNVNKRRLQILNPNTDHINLHSITR